MLKWMESSPHKVTMTALPFRPAAEVGIGTVVGDNAKITYLISTASGTACGIRNAE